MGGYRQTVVNRVSGVLFGAIIAFAGSAWASTVDFIVDDRGEATDANPGDGSCQTSGAVCTLRAALQEVNALSASDDYVIHLPPNTYTISTTLPDVTRDVTIMSTDAATCSIRSS